MEIVRLIEAASASEAAWERAWRVIEPMLWDFVDRPRFASHLAHTEESRRRIVATTRAQLGAEHCYRLQLYLDARRLSPRLSFARWLRAFVKRVAMSYASDDHQAPPVRRRYAQR